MISRLLSILLLITLLASSSYSFLDRGPVLAAGSLETAVDLTYFNDCHQNGGAAKLESLYRQNINILYQNAAVKALDLKEQARLRQAPKGQRVELDTVQQVEKAKNTAGQKSQSWQDVPQAVATINQYLDSVKAQQTKSTEALATAWNQYQAELFKLTSANGRLAQEISSVKSAHLLEAEDIIKDLQFNCGRSWPSQKTRDLDGAKQFIRASRRIDARYTNLINNQILHGMLRDYINTLDQELQQSREHIWTTFSESIAMAKQSLDQALSRIGQIEPNHDRQFCTTGIKTESALDSIKLEQKLNALSGQVSSYFSSINSQKLAWSNGARLQITQSRQDLANAIQAARAKYQSGAETNRLINQFNQESVSLIDNYQAQFLSLSRQLDQELSLGQNSATEWVGSQLSQSRAQMTEAKSMATLNCGRDPQGNRVGSSPQSVYRGQIGALNQQLSDSVRANWSNGVTKQITAKATAGAESQLRGYRSQLNQDMQALKLEYSHLLSAYRR